VPAIAESAEALVEASVEMLVEMLVDKAASAEAN